ncbi:MAG: class I SAM-dependent methyltransferase [Magnetococcales bacterium]|nr:class I SAM-dependent methyltransferase [Magnetococcales bacterium]
MNLQPTAYDVIPYESWPFSQSHPSHLYTIGRLFGMSPPDFRRARVLEIGCASGGNLLPMAALYPEASFLGVDASCNQVERGQKFLAELGLNNVELRHILVENLEEEPFDYILCHGVLSWVNETVQQAILSKVGRLLTANGIAYISYNALPGWNMVRSLREMMQYHTEGFAEPATKATQARLLLNFLRDNASFDPHSPYRQFLTSEIDLLSGQSDNYFLHDHLEQHNIPLYFHQFVRMAGAVGLQYLGEANLPTMFTVNYNQGAQAILGTTNDIIRQEQYMDFLTNRRFRTTLLCRDHVPLKRNLSLQSLDGFYLQSLLQPEEGHTETTPDFRAFASPNGARVTSDHPITIAVLTEIANRKQYPFLLSELIASVCARQSGLTSEAVATNLQEWLMTLFAKGGLVLSAVAPPYTAQISLRPEAWSFARAQARHQTWVTTMRHEPNHLDIFALTLLQHLDGTRTMEDMIALVEQQVRQGNLMFHLDGQPVTDPDALLEFIKTMFVHQLDVFAQNALLVR